jgi:hypothetical protein
MADRYSRKRLTPELTTEFARLIRAGNYVLTACNALGLNRRMVYQWLEFGEHEDDRRNGFAAEDTRPVSKAQAEKCLQFYRAVRRAEAEVEVQTIGRIQELGLPQEYTEDPKGRLVPIVRVGGTVKLPGDIRALTEFASKRFPDRWGGRQTLRHEGPGGGPLQVQAVDVQAVVSDAEAAELACQLLDRLGRGADDTGGAGEAPGDVPVPGGTAPEPAEPPPAGPDGGAADAADGDHAAAPRQE